MAWQLPTRGALQVDTACATHLIPDEGYVPYKYCCAPRLLDHKVISAVRSKPCPCLVRSICVMTFDETAFSENKRALETFSISSKIDFSVHLLALAQ